MRPISHPALVRYRVSTTHDHDAGYKRLFSAPEMMRDLLLGFVGHDFRSVTAHLLEWLSGDEHQRIRRAFALWLNRRLRHRMPEANIPETDDLAEVHSMFPDDLLAEIERKARAAERKAHRKGLQEGRQEGRQVGLQEGRQEGLQEGRHEAEVTILLRLLERRFGPLSPEIRQRIVSADPARIGQWFDQAIDAPDLKTLFPMQ